MLITGIVSILAVVFTGVMYFMRIHAYREIKSTKFFDIAKETVEKANKLLHDYEVYKNVSRWLLIVTVVLVVIMVATIWMNKRKKKKTEE